MVGRKTFSSIFSFTLFGWQKSVKPFSFGVKLLSQWWKTIFLSKWRENYFPYLSCTLLSLPPYFPFHFPFISSFFLHVTKQRKTNFGIVFSIVNCFPWKSFYTENILRLTKRSLSVPQMMKNGYSIHFVANTCKILNPFDKEIAKVPMINKSFPDSTYYAYKSESNETYWL